MSSANRNRANSSKLSSFSLIQFSSFHSLRLQDSWRHVLRIQSCAYFMVMMQINPGERWGSNKGPEANNYYETNSLPLSKLGPAGALTYHNIFKKLKYYIYK